MKSRLLVVLFLFLVLHTYGQKVIEKNYIANLENDAVHRYLNEVIYNPGDTSVIDDYRKDTNYRMDHPACVAMSIDDTEIDSVLIECYNYETQDDSLSFKVAVDNGNIELYNLVPNCNYFYRILAADSLLQEGYINTKGQLRMLKIPGTVANVRDMGGWETTDGKIIKYGKLFRGTELNGNHTITEEGIQLFRELGVGAELDLRAYYNKAGNNISVFNFKHDYETMAGEVPTYFYIGKPDNGQLTSHLTQADKLEKWRKEFNFIINNLRQERAIYIHCVSGKDRVGYLCFLLEGLLGLSYENLVKDYELSYFAYNDKSTKDSIDKVFEFIEQLEGETLRSKFNYYFTNKIGVLQTDIDYFMNEMLLNKEDEEIVTNIKHISKHSDIKNTIYSIMGTPLSTINKGCLYLIRDKKGKVHKVFKQ